MPPPPPPPPRAAAATATLTVDVGSVVEVRGTPSWFRGALQLRVQKVFARRTTADEVAFWRRAAALRADVLGRPWALDDKTVRRCRREAMAMGGGGGDGDGRRSNGERGGARKPGRGGAAAGDGEGEEGGERARKKNKRARGEDGDEKSGGDRRRDGAEETEPFGGGIWQDAEQSHKRTGRSARERSIRSGAGQGKTAAGGAYNALGL